MTIKPETVFREKSIERLSSPDQLNDYIRLTNPGVWSVLSAIIVILAGACVFGIFGHIDSTVPAVGVAKDGEMVCLVREKYRDRFSDDMKVKLDGGEYDASLRTAEPVPLPEGTDSYARYLGGFKAGERVYELHVHGTFKDGDYEVKLITEQISPFSFLLNNQ